MIKNIFNFYYNIKNVNITIYSILTCNNILKKKLIHNFFNSVDLH